MQLGVETLEELLARGRVTLVRGRKERGQIGFHVMRPWMGNAGRTPRERKSIGAAASVSCQHAVRNPRRARCTPRARPKRSFPRWAVTASSALRQRNRCEQRRMSNHRRNQRDQRNPGCHLQTSTVAFDLPLRNVCHRESSSLMDNRTASLANRIAARKRGHSYDERFIVNLNIVVQPSLPCISLHASYDVSLNLVQRTR